MKLKELEKQRDLYATRITKMAIHIAVIFAIPAFLCLGISHWFNVAIEYILPFAFVLSWILVIRMYRKIERQVRSLEERIKELKKEELSSLSED